LLLPVERDYYQNNFLFSKIQMPIKFFHDILRSQTDYTRPLYFEASLETKKRKTIQRKSINSIERSQSFVDFWRRNNPLHRQHVVIMHLQVLRVGGMIEKGTTLGSPRGLVDASLTSQDPFRAVARKFLRVFLQSTASGG